jgi:hypothetical protein
VVVEIARIQNQVTQQLQSLSLGIEMDQVRTNEYLHQSVSRLAVMAVLFNTVESTSSSSSTDAYADDTDAQQRRLRRIAQIQAAEQQLCTVIEQPEQALLHLQLNEQPVSTQ